MNFAYPCKARFRFVVGIRYGNGFFILLEVAGFRGCTIIGGVRNRQCVGDVGAFAIQNTQIKLVHSLNCIFAHSCFAVLHTKIRNITFRDCYNGHVIQVAGSDNVLIENCRFEGQSFRGSGDKTRELLQIEPGTVKGYPYTLVQNKAPSTNVTIRNCYFGGSENTPHYMAAIGTHSQQAGVKCSDIVIEDCTFDNAAYTAIHFMAYDRITIRNNIFTITSDSEQIDRYGILADTYGSFIDPTGAESTTDFTIEGNTFDVSDPKATVLEITTNNKSPKHIKNVTIKDNTLKGVNGGKAIDLYLLDNCTISGNTIEGFERPIVANSCDEQLISDTDIVTE